MRTWIQGLLLTLVCAVAGAGVVWWYTTSTLPEEAETTERAHLAAEGLRDSPVYIDPSSEGLFTDAELEQIETAAAASDPRVFVVVWPDSGEAGYRFSNDVLRQIGALLGEPGLYMELTPGDQLTGLDIGMDAGYLSAREFYESWSSSLATSHLLEIIADNDGRGYELGESSDGGYWGGTGGMVAAILLIGVFGGGLVGGIVLIVWYVRRHRRAALAAQGAPGARR